MSDKLITIVYVARLYLRGRGVVDLVERNDEILARVAFNDMVKEANDDDFGEGIYETSLMEEWFDQEGHLEHYKLLKNIVIDRGDEL